jgi:hypothetical protein
MHLFKKNCWSRRIKNLVMEFNILVNWSGVFCSFSLKIDLWSTRVICLVFAVLFQIITFKVLQKGLGKIESRIKKRTKNKNCSPKNLSFRSVSWEKEENKNTAVKKALQQSGGQNSGGSDGSTGIVFCYQRNTIVRFLITTIE